MKIEKRYVIGILLLIPFLPVFLLGFVVYWLWCYAEHGYCLGESVNQWIADKVNGTKTTTSEDW